MRTHVADERGMTLLELVVVFVLATLVMVGLVSFYLGSQQTWMDASDQTQLQREATLVVEMLSDSVRVAASALVSDYPDATQQSVSLYAAGAVTPFICFWRDPLDSSLYCNKLIGDESRGRLIPSKVSRFQLRRIGTSMVELTLLELPNVSGNPVRTSSRFALYNR
jgi:type II secretory pathway pseudopilin PulG